MAEAQHNNENISAYRNISVVVFHSTSFKAIPAGGFTTLLMRPK
jgi:hypothetical protein